MQTASYKLTADNRVPLLTTLNRNIQNWLQNTPELELTVRPFKSKRNVEQNKRLWALYRQIADSVWVDGRQYSSDVWHEYCKAKFLGYNITLLPDGSELKIPISTTTLNTKEHADYQNAIEAHFSEEYGLIWEI